MGEEEGKDGEEVKTRKKKKEKRKKEKKEWDSYSEITVVGFSKSIKKGRDKIDSLIPK